MSELFDVIPTSIPDLDTILGGGIPAGALLLVVGSPGTGKTVLTQQICFNLVARGLGRALYFSTLSEPHDKLVRQLQSFAFYDANHLGDSVMLLALQEFLKQGLEAIAEVILRTTRQQQARLVCIDGYRAIEAICKNEVDSRQFLYQLSSQLHVLGATVLVTLEHAPQDRDDYGAYTVADGVLVCHHDLVNMQRQRKVEVKKLRTIAHLHGLHSYRIDTRGWTVYPRIETLVPTEIVAHARTGAVARQGFGIAELDRLFGGGVPAGSTTLIAGGAGVGKTLLALHYLGEGLRQNEPSLFLSFNERRDQLLDKARYFGLPLAEGEQTDLLRIRTFAPVEVEPDEISTAIRQEAASRGIRRVVIDTTYELERATAREGRTHDYLGALVTYLRDTGVTMCMTKQMHKLGVDELDFSNTPLSVVAENVVLLRYIDSDRQLERMLSVLKMRDSAYDPGSYTYTIGPGGVTITGRFDQTSTPCI